HYWMISTAALCAAIAAGCAGPRPMQNPRTTSAVAPGAEAQAMSLDDQNTDGEIATIAATAYVAAQEAAREAVARATQPQVRRFANHMLAAYGQARHEQAEITRRLALPVVPSPTSERLEANSQRTMALLHGAMGADFDRAYVASQSQQLGAIADLIG